MNSRREFLRYFFLGSVATWAMAALYGLSRFFAPARAKAGALPKFVELKKKPDSIESNSSMIFNFGDRPALLVREKSGKFMAFFATCTHLECIVQYNPNSQMIVCPCHDGVFDLKGKNISGPPTEPLDALAVQVRDNTIRVIRRGTDEA